MSNIREGLPPQVRARIASLEFERLPFDEIVERVASEFPECTESAIKAAAAIGVPHESSPPERSSIVTPKAEPRRGRPVGRNREQRAINLEPKIWTWLEGKKRSGESLNDTISRILTDDMARDG